MTLKRLVVDSKTIDLRQETTALPEDFHTLLENAILASREDPFDPMERALRAAGDHFLIRTEHLHPDWTMVREYPLTPELLAISQAWKRGADEELVVASKGAPEAIAELCHIAPEKRTAIVREAARLASGGLRVLGVARGQAAHLPAEHHDLSLEFIGLLGFEDPLRPAVREAVAECQTAGIRVVMITGDYPETARSIGRQAGLASPDSFITGPQLRSMSDEQLAARIADVQIFARVVPEQKLRIVSAFKANHEIVAMTGDGVNDAPALKAAHIGIAMGGRGTDVAREAASLVLLDDDFSSIVAAVKLGRRIFDNIKKAVAFILAVHVPIAGLSMLPVFFPGWPLLLLPVHIVFLELIIDPSCSLIFEAEEPEPGVMKRPPRNPAERLFSLSTIGMAVLQGLSVLGVCLAVFLLSRSNHSADAARALTFATLVVSIVVIILANRSWTRTIVSVMRVPNTALWWVIGGTAGCLAVIMSVPGAQALFHFAPLHGRDLALSLLAGAACVTWFELLKLTNWWRRIARGGSKAAGPAN